LALFWEFLDPNPFQTHLSSRIFKAISPYFLHEKREAFFVFSGEFEGYSAQAGLSSKSLFADFV